MSPRPLNGWWLLPGAFALVAVAVFDLRGGQLSGAAVDVATGTAFYLSGAIAYLARPANRSAWLLLLTGTLLAIGKALGAGWSEAAANQPDLAHSWVGVVLLNACSWAFFASGVALFATFPDGNFQRGYERVIVRFVVLAYVPLQVLQLLGSARVAAGQFGWVPIDGPSPIHLAGLEPIGLVAGTAMTANVWGIVPALSLLVLRYRRFGPEQQRQIKWPLYTVGLAAISFVLIFFGPGPPVIPFWLAAFQYLATLAILPAGLAMGIVVHRSVDIEDVIRRSVVYGVLWALIALVYLVGAAAFGIAVGQQVPLALAVFLTIVATLGFQPARRRLERLADRLVFGPRLSGYELISHLGARLESSVAAEDVAGTVALAVHAGLNAGWVRVALDRPERATVAAVGIEGSTVALTAPLVHDGQVVGVIDCGPKAEGRYAPGDQELLTTLGRQAALAIRNSQLSAELSERLQELAASRVRLVQAEDAGRRRLERDLHDGIQQELVGLMARLGLARNQLRRDAALAETTLREAQVDAQRALESVQEVARGIHPAVLTDRGLVEAIEERAARMTVPVEVHADGLARGARFRPELEGAAYFVVAEGLANVLKHSSASRARVRLHSDQRCLAIEVADEGRGFEPGSQKLSGLVGLRDRVETIGGSVQVTSRPGQGTILRASFPLGNH
ncbi:MAG TPA: GAF domain-containing sensor histidine kinase [Candidatus Dormibacteraeota bacterium]|nr:GAF domain-containing sensor histidine kinase [Candidatus Dormibacteraeota bacterium]